MSSRQTHGGGVGTPATDGDENEGGVALKARKSNLLIVFYL